MDSYVTSYYSTYYRYRRIKMSQSLIKKSICLLTASLALTSLLAGCGSKETTEPGAAAPSISISVETQNIVPQTIEQYVQISSKALSDSEVAIIPKVSGTVKNVYVNIGDAVKAGDILFEIDDTDLRLQAQQAEAGLQAAQSGLHAAQASYQMNVGGNLETQLLQLQSTVSNLEIQYNDLLKNYENTKKLFEAGSVSQKDLDDMSSNVSKLKLQLDTAQQNLKITKEKIIEETKNASVATIHQAEASVNQAQASVQGATNQLKHTQVRAEIDGIISSSSVTKGALISPQGVAMTLVNMDKIKLSFNVSDAVINKIAVGSKAYITIAAASETPFEGTITHISPAANSQTLLYPVEIYMDNPNHTIKPGMFATLKLVVAQKEHTISVPLNAVIQEGNEKYVYIVDDTQTSRKVAVETGLQNDTHIQITKGIELGQQVIVTGQDFVSDGTSVNIVKSY